MRVIDRLILFLKHHHIPHHQFEKKCGIANGYLKKQSKGKGTIGSEILEKILSTYRDLSLTWLITGTGTMLADTNDHHYSESLTMHEEAADYISARDVIGLLHNKIKVLENALADKEKIIKMLEEKQEQ